jgi:prepilin peptidase CpaA
MWMGKRGELIVVFLFTVWIAWGDVKTRRIPNYLTLSIALSGLVYQVAAHGLQGLGAGAAGMAIGLGFLLLPYIWGGMGAGDVKALAALGAWLGPWSTLYLCAYMGMAGGVLALAVIFWKGGVAQKLRQGWNAVANYFLLSRHHGIQPDAAPTPKTPGIPYGVAIALGMAALLATTTIN